MTFENLNKSKIADCGQKQANIILIIKNKVNYIIYYPKYLVVKYILINFAAC